MKSTQNKYTKEEFVKAFLMRQAQAKAQKSLEEKQALKVESNKSEKETNICKKDRKSVQKKTDLTDTKKVFETKTIKEEPEKVIKISPSKESKVQVEEDKKVNTAEKRNVNFKIEIVYSSKDLNFSGLDLMEKELKDGNLQVGFDVNVGTFTGETVKKIVRRRKQKDKSEEKHAQLSFK